MESLFGIPSHPLFVHLPVVVIPVAAVVAVVLAFSPPLRPRLSSWLAGLVGVGLLSTFLATRSGEAFYDAIEDRIGELAETHEELGRQTLILVALFFVAAAITAIVDRLAARSPGDDQGQLRLPATVLAVGTALLGIVAAAWMVRTGHEGARIVWDGVLPTD